MQDFFSLKPGFFHFKLFGVIHLSITLLMILFIVLIYKNKDKIRIWKHHDKFIRYSIAIFMFLNMFIYYGEKVLSGTWSYKVHLPLHFCFISGYLFMYTLLTNNKKLFKYIYFFSFAGPLPAIVFPDLVCGMDRFIFWQFVISHHFFLIASMYMLYVLNWKIEKKDTMKALVLANVIFILVYLFNITFHTNYIMTDKLPNHVLTLMPFLKHFNYPILWLELAGIIAWIIGYIPVHFYNKKQEPI